MKRALPLLVLSVLLLSACNKNINQANSEDSKAPTVSEKNVRPPVPQKSAESSKEMPKENNAAKVPAPVVAEASGRFTNYEEGVIGNGKKSVLFFHATWCPKCKANSELLVSWYGSEKFPRSVYKIDYDTSIDLKKQFGVTGQDTFILIDENGKEVSRSQFPSSSALRDLLG